MGSRSVGLGLALSVALAAAPARAATLTYDLAGTSTYRTRSDVVPDPPGYFETPLSAGSTLTLEFDANGDGVSGDVTVVGSELRVQETLTPVLPPEFAFTITTDVVLEITGGLGHRFGPIYDQFSGIDWWGEPAHVSISGTYVCSGPGCSLVGLPEGEPLPYDGPAPVEELYLGIWLFDVGPARELETGCVDYAGGCIFPLVTATEPGDPTRWATALRISGRPVPEPATAVLLAAGLLLLARRRIA